MLEVEIEEGANRGARYALAPGENAVGRDASCAVLVIDERASRRHANVVRSSDGRLTVEDLGSRNGTLRNGLPLEAGKPVEIGDGDRITIGGTTLLLRERDAVRECAPSGRTTVLGRASVAKVVGEVDAARVLAFVAGLASGKLGSDLASALGEALALAGGERAAFFVKGATVEVLAASHDLPPALPLEAVEALERPEPEALELEGALAISFPPSTLLVVAGAPEGGTPAWAAIASALVPRVLAARETRALRAEAEEARRAALREVELVGESEPMKKLVEATARAATRDAPVLVLGESGTGKELVARALHAASGRARRRFVPVNAAALPETLLESELFGHDRGAFTGAVARRKGLLELAHEGTLFLDEVGELPLSVQPKLLRVLESGEVRPLGSNEVKRVSVRLVAATHRDLEKLVAEGRFRQDLYFRLAVLVLRVPALRERREDIPLLARHLLRGIARGREVAIEPAALERLKGLRFAGNVRELRNLLERAWLEGEGAIRAASIPAGGSDDATFPTLAELERRHLEAAIAKTAGNRSAAAKLLGIDRKTLWARLKALGMDDA
ncbi:MAG TPA: sigma 54-interacting transcriptional regulator [Planctomycetota bacterium]|nr:sigma 54-interacting transcriptional regulator [Planctomycetota bacterium]